jgi:hypothetical protein
MSSFNPYSRAGVGVNMARGVVFVVVLAAIWTAVIHSPIGGSAFPVGLLQLAALGVLIYLFARFW